MHLANALPIFGHQKGWLKALKAKGILRFYHHIAPGAVIYKQPTGNVDGNHFITTIINVFYQVGG